MPRAGLEPARPKTLAPKASEYTFLHLGKDHGVGREARTPTGISPCASETQLYACSSIPTLCDWRYAVLHGQATWLHTRIPRRCNSARCLAGGRACALSPSRLCRLPVALAALVGSKNFGGDGGNRTHVLPLCRRQPEPSRRHPQEFSCQCPAGNRCRTPTPAKEFEDQYGIRTCIFAVCGKYKLLSLDSAEIPHCQLCAPGLICDGGSRTRTRLLQAV